jgi:hypothetical protein
VIQSNSTVGNLIQQTIGIEHESTLEDVNPLIKVQELLANSKALKLMAPEVFQKQAKSKIRTISQTHFCEDSKKRATRNPKLQNNSYVSNIVPNVDVFQTYFLPIYQNLNEHLVTQSSVYQTHSHFNFPFSIKGHPKKKNEGRLDQAEEIGNMTLTTVQSDFRKIKNN